MTGAPHYCDERQPPGECVVCAGQPPRLFAPTTRSGVVRLPVEVLRRTRKCYRVRLLEHTALCGGIGRGGVRYVPHAAVLDRDGRPLEVL